MELKMEGRIKEIVDILLKIKTLEGFDIFRSIDNYLLSPNELRLFKDIPISLIDEDALNLSHKKNVGGFIVMLVLRDRWRS